MSFLFVIYVHMSAALFQMISKSFFRYWFSASSYRGPADILGIDSLLTYFVMFDICSYRINNYLHVISGLAGIMFCLFSTFYPNYLLCIRFRPYVSLTQFMHVVYDLCTDWHISFSISYWLGEPLHWRYKDWSNH